MPGTLRRVGREANRRVQHWRSPVAYFRSQGARIGDNVEIFGSTIHSLGSEPYLVTVGSDVTISEGALFITHDGGLRVMRDRNPDAYLYAPIVVEDGAFIGTRAILLPGVTVGRKAVIGAGAVVSRSIPAGTVAVGVPARAIKSIEEYWHGAKERVVGTGALTAQAKRELLMTMVAA